MLVANFAKSSVCIVSINHAGPELGLRSVCTREGGGDAGVR